MQTKQLIEASAEVITITRFKVGDVYKRLQAAAYSSDTAEIRYGVVMDIMNNGTEAALVAFEVVSAYSGVTVEQKVFKAGADVALFAATPAEIDKHFDNILEATTRKILKARTELAEAENIDRAARVVIDQISHSVLTPPTTITGAVEPTPEPEEQPALELAPDDDEPVTAVDRTLGVED